MKKLLLSIALVGLAVSGCSFGSSEANLGNISQDQPTINPQDPNVSAIPVNPEQPQDPTNPVDPNQTPPPPANHCDFGKSYTGFGGTVLEVGRIDNEVTMEGGRMKPYTSLVTEYPRVLGNNPTLLTGMNATFSDPVVRWFVEPQGSAISIYTAYRIGFQGCLTLTGTGTQWTSVPNATTAATECGNFARKFWSRNATADEIAACVQIATVDTVNEGSTPTTPQRRWAYTCASVLASAGFLTY